MNDVFISYSRDDKPFAMKIKQALEDNGFEVWIDLDDINYSQDWQEEIYKGIEESINFIFIVSNSSNQSVYCQREIDYAITHNKRLIPIRMFDKVMENAHPEISKKHSIVFENEDEFSNSLEILINTIHTDFEWAKQHTDFLNKALEWERAGSPNHKLLKKSDLESGIQFLNLGTTGIEPRPTELQVEFIEKSRLIDHRNKRRYLLLGIITILILSVSLFYSIIQRNNAVTQQIIADDQRNIAQTQSNIAEEQRNYAQTQSSIAEEQRNMAETQTIFAMNRLLISESEQTRGTQFDVSSLLGIEAWRLLENSSSRSNLYDLYYSTSEIDWTIVGKHDHPTAMTLSPENDYLISADGRLIRVWDAVTGDRINQFDELGNVWALEVSPDGTYLATGDSEGDLLFWNFREDKDAYAYCYNSDTYTIGITDIAFSPDGKLIAAAYMDGTIRFWDTETYEMIFQIDEATPPITSDEMLQHIYGSAVYYVQITMHFNISFSPDGKYFVWSDNQNNSVVIINANDYSLVKRISGHRGIITSLLISSDNQLFVASAGEVYQWDIVSGNFISQYTAGLETASIELDFIGDQNHIISVGNNSNILIREILSGSYIKDIQYGFSGAVYFVKGNTNTKNFYTLGGDGNLIAWNYSNDGSTRTINAHEDTILDLSLSPDFITMVSVGLDLQVMLWDLDSLDAVGSSAWGGDYSINSVVYHPSGNYFYTGGGDNTIGVWDANTGKLLDSFSAGSDEVNWIYKLIISPDGNQIISCHHDGSIIFWNTTDDKLEKVNKISRNGTVLRASITPIGDKLVFTEGLYNLVIWDIERGEEIFTIDTVSPGRVSNIQISNNGDWLILGKGTYLQIYDLKTGELVNDEIRINEVFESIALSPDNTFISIAVLTQNGETGIKFVDLSTGNVIARIQTEELATILQFSPDGTRLFTGNANGEIKTYTFDIDQIIIRLCDIAGRNLTEFEWSKYIPGYDYQLTCSE